MQRYILIIASICFFFTTEISRSEEPRGNLKSKMLVVYESFRDLQPYLAKSDDFQDPRNYDTILRLIKSLSSNFHALDAFSTKYKDEPGFASQISVLIDTLDDALRRFQEKNTSYSLWRMKSVSSNCVACHTSYKVEVTFYDPREEPPSLNSFQKGEFYLATRQFDRAEDSYLKAIEDPQQRNLRMEALRKWLVIYTRVHPDPKKAISKLSNIYIGGNFTSYEKEEIQEWIESLKQWEAEPKTSASALRKAENLVQQGVAMDDPLFSSVHTVELLRATSILHTELENKGIHGSDRAKALYLLGLSYSKLPLFRVNELPEFFLEQCIQEYAGSDEAKRSYRLLKDIIILGYTGSGGTRVPGDVAAKLQELHDKAYGIPRFEERV